MRGGTTLVRIAALVLALSVNGCATTHVASCGREQKPMVDDSLYFGLAKRGGDVTSEEWSRFLEVVVTPRFPQGLSVFEASGQWRGANGTIGREATRVLRVVHPNDEADEARVAEIIAAYKTQFDQESVLRVRVDACASF